MMGIIQYVNAVSPGLGFVDTFSIERKDLTSCSAEARLPPTFFSIHPERDSQGPRLLAW